MQRYDKRKALTSEINVRIFLTFFNNYVNKNNFDLIIINALIYILSALIYNIGSNIHEIFNDHIRIIDSQKCRNSIINEN